MVSRCQLLRNVVNNQLQWPCRRQTFFPCSVAAGLYFSLARHLAPAEKTTFYSSPECTSVVVILIIFNISFFSWMATLSLILPLERPSPPGTHSGQSEGARGDLISTRPALLFKRPFTSQPREHRIPAVTEGQRIWYFEDHFQWKTLYEMVGIKVFNSPVSVFL